MRVALDARLYGLTHRGIGRYLVELIRSLSQIGREHEFVLLTDPRNPEQPHGLPGNFSTVPVAARVYTMAEQVAVVRAVRGIRPDVTHVPHFSAPVLLPRPYVLTVHDLILHHFPSERATTLPTPLYWAKLVGYRLVVATALRRASRVLVPSRAVAADVAQFYPWAHSKLEVVPLAPGRAAPGVAAPAPSYPYVLVVGAAYPHKNLERAVAAVVAARRVLPELRLLIVGRRDEFMQRLERHVAEQGSSVAIQFYGEADEPTLVQLYQGAACYLQPSLAEGFGLGPLEALQQGTPVVASDIPVFHEVLGSAAMFVNPQSVDDMARAIVTVIGRGRTNSVPAGAPRYSWDETARLTLAAYRSARG